MLALDDLHKAADRFLQGQKLTLHAGKLLGNAKGLG